MPDNGAWTKTIVTDAHVTIALPEPAWWEVSMVAEKNGVSRQEARAKLLQREADELERFLRDHRSRDNYQLDVVRETQEVCRFCGREAEMDEDGPVCCAAAENAWRKAAVKGA